MSAVIHHAGISTLTALAASSLTVAAFINPLGATLCAAGAICWLLNHGHRH
jgi:hypothetical protein